MAEQSIPDYCEPLIGYRVWTVTPDHRLRALSMGTFWTPYQREEARHASSTWFSNADPPVDDTACFRSGLCANCGIYALKSMDDAIAMMSDLLSPFAYVVGRVALWGRVVVHTHGYRAQYAYPQTILGAQDCDGPAIAANYGIPFEEDPTWKSATLLRQSSWNRYASLSHFGLFQTFPAFQIWNLNQYGNPAWSSRSILQPDEHAILVEPPPPEGAQAAPVPHPARTGDPGVLPDAGRGLGARRPRGAGHRGRSDRVLLGDRV